MQGSDFRLQIHSSDSNLHSEISSCSFI